MKAIFSHDHLLCLGPPGHFNGGGCGLTSHLRIDRNSQSIHLWFEKSGTWLRLSKMGMGNLFEGLLFQCPGDSQLHQWASPERRENNCFLLSPSTYILSLKHDVLPNEFMTVTFQLDERCVLWVNLKTELQHTDWLYTRCTGVLSPPLHRLWGKMTFKPNTLLSCDIWGQVLQHGASWLKR